MENPDLAHRARRQGLASAVREMEDQGYTIVENAITPAFAEEAREEIIGRIAKALGRCVVNDEVVSEAHMMFGLIET